MQTLEKEFSEMSGVHFQSENARICRHCGEEVLLKKPKKHFEEFHHIVTCVKCGKDVVRCQEGFHLAYECKKRARCVPCQFCDLLLPRGKMKKHEELCGSRTAVCDICDRYILIKDRDKHLRSCKGENPALPCEFCERLIPANMLGSHQQQCLIERERAQVITGGNEGTSWGTTDTSKGDRTDETRSTMETQRKWRKEKARDGPNTGKEGRQKFRVEEKSIVALPCEICGELCPSDKLMQHQAECNEESQNRHDNSAPRSRERQEAEQHLLFHETKPKSRKQHSTEVPRERYIEIQRSYSPTIQFGDDCFTDGFSSYFRDDTEHSFTRTRGKTASFQQPRDIPLSSDRSNGFSEIPTVRYIEIERSYSPTIEFGEEHFPEASMDFIPENFHIQQTFDWFESRHSSW